MRPFQASARGVQPRIQRFGRQPGSKPRRGAQDRPGGSRSEAKWVCNVSCDPFCGSVPLLSITFPIYPSFFPTLPHPLPSGFTSASIPIAWLSTQLRTGPSPVTWSSPVRSFSSIRPLEPPSPDVPVLQRFCPACPHAGNVLRAPLGPCRCHGCGAPFPWPPAPFRGLRLAHSLCTDLPPYPIPPHSGPSIRCLLPFDASCVR